MGNIVVMNFSMKWVAIWVLVALAGCQKELHEPEVRVEPPVKQKKFIKFSTFSLPDSLIVFQREYGYDGDDKLNSIKTTERFQQPNGTIRTQTSLRRFFRDNVGRINKISTGPDSSIFVMEFGYNGTNSRNPLNAVSYRIRNGISTLLDSVAISYNASGRVDKTIRFMLLNGGKLDTSSYETYTYDGIGNLAGKLQYSDSAGNRRFRVVIGYSWQYDSKNNPLFFDEIPYFFNDGPFAYTASSNNVTRQINNYAFSPSDELSYFFEYDSENRLKVSRSAGDQKLVTLYYYEQ